MGALRWHGEPCQGKKQVNEVQQPHWAVPGVWKPEHFQAAVGSGIPAKFLSRGSSDCWPSSSVSLVCPANLSRHSLLFEVINEAFNIKQHRLCLHTPFRESLHTPGSPEHCVSPPGMLLPGWS